MRFTIYTANVTGAQDNCVYPRRHEITDAASLAQAVRKDHVCAEYKNSYRGKENFIASNCVVMDVDNDHSENPADWILPEALAEEYADIRFAICFSRSHKKQKGQYGPRPRFHIYFEVEPITDQEAYSALKTALYAMYPFYDDNALDSGRFIYGADPGEVLWHEGSRTIESILDADGTEPLIPEGSRNKSMYQWAVCYLKREGNGEDSEKAFYREAEKCTPPLADKELQTIWRSAVRFYERKVRTDPSYVEPQEFKTGIPSKWEEPIPFGKYTILPFPADALPRDIGEYVKAVAESTQTPVDMAGTAALAAIAVCTQGKYKIQGKADWIEPLNGYFIVINPPSERKSAVEHSIVKPLDAYEEQYNIRCAGAVEASKMRRRILEKRQKAIEDQVAKGKADAEELDKIAQEITDFEEVRPLQLYVDDITTEKLVSVMAANHGRAALVSSEGGIFDTLAGIYTKNVNIDVMLKGYSGDPIRVDRIGRESESIMDPALTVLLMAQPNVLSEVMRNTTFRGRGLTARFLYSMPASFVGTRNFESRPVPETVYQDYEQKIVNLLEDEYTRKPELITLSEQAAAKLSAFASEIEPRLVSDLAEMSDWAGKLVGNVLRLSGLLCRAGVFRSHDFLMGEKPLQVDGRTMENAIRLGRYYLNHAQAIYSVLPENAMHKKASRILQMIADNGLDTFDRRTAMRLGRIFHTTAEIQPVLDFLEDYGYIVQVPQKYSGCGRPPQPKYVVNPLAKNMICPSVTPMSQEACKKSEA